MIGNSFFLEEIDDGFHKVLEDHSDDNTIAQRTENGKMQRII